VMVYLTMDESWEECTETAAARARMVRLENLMFSCLV
jgi:hypothetical protein